MLSSHALDQTMAHLWDRTEIIRVLQSRFQHISSDLQYDANDEPEALPLLSFYTKAEGQHFHQRLIDDPSLTQTHPLYLLVLIFQERYGIWGESFARQWKTVMDVEAATGMTSKEWVTRYVASGAEQSPRSTRDLLEMVHEAKAELLHLGTVMKYVRRFGDVTVGAVRQFDEARGKLGLPMLKKREREALERRIMQVVSQCEAIDDRLPKLRARLNGQIRVVFALIAEKDSRSRATIAERQVFIAEMAAQDSRVMRIIGLLTLLFLPTTLVTTLWGTNLVNFEPLVNWAAWLGSSTGLTILVTVGLWLYDRQAAGNRHF
ncbi:hypothetical protein MFIFM68171_06545 [Madurella fahalii]|uniref:Uncharacterized protein n=1 Tax=Madurella fahalii TaxID=1157608 RepID=A0ABQ0GFL5_9PEZI